MSEEKEYVVRWSIPVTASSPEDAACQALGIQRDPHSIATVFTVDVDDGPDIVVDVEDPDDPVRLRSLRAAN